VKLVLKNAAKWAAPTGSRWLDGAPNIPVEKAPERIVARGPKLHAEGEEGYK
jgi:trehalose utilization protein